MTEQNLYLLRYKKGHAGVQLNMIKARSLPVAEAIGRRFCDDHIGYRYIAVEDAVIADETLIGAQQLDAILNPPARPKGPEPYRKSVPLQDLPNAVPIGDNNLDDIDDDEESAVALASATAPPTKLPPMKLPVAKK